MKHAALLVFAFSLALCPAAQARLWTPLQVEDLERAARAAPEEGLSLPAGLDPFTAMRRVRSVDPTYQPALDLAADALFTELAETFARGAVAPASVDRNWRLPLPTPPDIAALNQALDAGAAPSALLHNLLPASSDYRALRAELALLAFEPDSETVRAQRSQVRANLERWRWLPRALPDRRVDVRLAQFELFFYPGAGAAPVKHAVIVGARRTPSPVFAANITSVTLNPDWTPPASILVNELLPRFRRNPSAAAREGFEALDDQGSVIAPGDIDWRARPFPYRLRQRPGAGNALGLVRFDLPNPYAVFLHDTPSRGLFERAERALSHGCIRVQNPVALAAVMLAAQGWDEAALQAAIDTGVMQSIDLSVPIPVFVLYLTAVAAEDGSLLYLDDIHRRDGALAAALEAPARTASVFEHGLCAP